MGLLRAKRRRADRDEVLHLVNEALFWLRPACGALVACQRRGAHPGCTGWLDDLERALARVDRVHQSIAHSQGWQEEPRP